MVKTSAKIIMKRDFDDRILLKTCFKGKFFFGELAFIPQSNNKFWLKCISGLGFYAPYIFNITREAIKLKPNEQRNLKVFMDL